MVIQNDLDMLVGARIGKNTNIPFIRKPAKWLLNIIANKDAKIIMIESKMIGRIETHSMIMDGEVMKMRKITPELKKNINYEFKPGGNHLMFFDIKRELKVNDDINLLFTFELKNKEILSKSILFKVK